MAYISVYIFLLSYRRKHILCFKYYLNVNEHSVFITEPEQHFIGRYNVYPALHCHSGEVHKKKA